MSEKPANSMIFRHFNFVTNIIYYIIRKMGYVPEKPVKSTIINGSIFSLQISSIYIKRKTGYMLEMPVNSMKTGN